ncbi:MAG: hypothetical protein ABEK50_12535 [bacterium]
MSNGRQGTFFWMYRLGLLMVGLPVLVLSIWMIAAPHHWFETFGWSTSWLGIHGPYNVHLILDFGFSQLALSVLILGGSLTMELRWIRLSLVAWLIYSLPHFLFHWLNHGGLRGPDRLLELSSLGFFVILPLLLLVYSGQLSDSGSPKLNQSSTDDSDDSLQRIPPASSIVGSGLKWMTERQFGKPLKNLDIVGHHGWVMFGAGMYEMAVDQFSAINPRLKSLVQLRVAQIVGCPW